MSKKHKIKKKSKFKILLVVEILLILIAGLVAFGYWYMQHSLDKVQKSDIKKEEIEVNSEVAPAEETDPYYSIVLYGVDSQSGQLEESNRSDSIIVVSLERETKKVRMLSIYRDTYIYVDEEYGYTKITHAYSYGGPKTAINTLNKNFDLNITDFVTVNFKILADCIDELGGVTVDVQQSALSDLNKYIPNMNKLNGGASGLIYNAGSQTLDGNQATAYARIRKNSGGDYKRAERQRAILSAMFDKLKSNPTKVTTLMNTIFPNVLTNLTKDEIMDLATDVTQYEIEDTVGFPFEPQGQSINGVYYGLPVTLESNTIKMHQFLYNDYEYTPSSNVKEYSTYIENIRNKSKDAGTTECPTTQWKDQR